MLPSRGPRPIVSRGLADLGNDAAASKFEDFGQFETEGFGEFPEKEKKEKKKTQGNM